MFCLFRSPILPSYLILLQKEEDFSSYSLFPYVPGGYDDRKALTEVPPALDRLTANETRLASLVTGCPTEEYPPYTVVVYASERAQRGAELGRESAVFETVHAKGQAVILANRDAIYYQPRRTWPLARWVVILDPAGRLVDEGGLFPALYGRRGEWAILQPHSIWFEVHPDAPPPAPPVPPVVPDDYSARVRFLVLKRDGYRCQLCGRDASDGVKLEVAHKLARAHGGPYTPDNLWTLCFDCNRGQRTDEP